MVTSQTCTFWLEFCACAREIPFPAGNAGFPAGIAVSHTWREMQPVGDPGLDKEWSGRMLGVALSSSDVPAQFLDLVMESPPGSPSTPGNALSPFSLPFPFNQEHFPCQEPL